MPGRPGKRYSWAFKKRMVQQRIGPTAVSATKLAEDLFSADEDDFTDKDSAS